MQASRVPAPRAISGATDTGHTERAYRLQADWLGSEMG